LRKTTHSLYQTIKNEWVKMIQAFLANLHVQAASTLAAQVAQAAVAVAAVAAVAADPALAESDSASVVVVTATSWKLLPLPEPTARRQVTPSCPNIPTDRRKGLFRPFPPPRQGNPS
jgi:hypothetical protein